MSIEENKSKYSFGRQSFNREISSINYPDWRANKRTSDQIRQSYRLSQGATKHPQYSNFTEDDIGDEGITELFNYLSDSESELSKRPSQTPQEKLRLQNSMFASRIKKLDEASNDTGTFAFGKQSDSNTLARESKEKSLIRTYSGSHLNLKINRSELSPEDLKEEKDSNEMILIGSARPKHDVKSDEEQEEEGIDFYV